MANYIIPDNETAISCPWPDVLREIAKTCAKFSGNLTSCNAFLAGLISFFFTVNRKSVAITVQLAPQIRGFMQRSLNGRHRFGNILLIISSWLED